MTIEYAETQSIDIDSFPEEFQARMLGMIADLQQLPPEMRYPGLVMLATLACRYLCCRDHFVDMLEQLSESLEIAAKVHSLDPDDVD